jgi:hypothetical protein
MVNGLQRSSERPERVLFGDRTIDYGPLQRWDHLGRKDLLSPEPLSDRAAVLRC